MAGKEDGKQRHSADNLEQRKEQLTDERLQLLELLEQQQQQAGSSTTTQEKRAAEQTAHHGAAAQSSVGYPFGNQYNNVNMSAASPWQQLMQQILTQQAAFGVSGNPGFNHPLQGNPLFNMQSAGVVPNVGQGFQQAGESGNSQPSVANNSADNTADGNGHLPPLEPLIAMKRSGSRNPFFCVHAVFGSAFPYYHLALHMEKEQPFYGIQSPGLDGKQAPLETIEVMASHYVKEMKTVQKKGPYHLGGYSFGSWVAFEIAQQLRRQGEKIGLLAMIGTGTPISMSNPPLFEQIEFMMQYYDDFNKLVVNSMLSDEVRLALNQHQQQQQQVGGNPQQPHLSPLNDVMQANNRAQLRYIPRPYPGKVTVFMTLEQQAAYPMDPSMGWKMLSTEPVESIQVSGTHLNMFYEPHVSDLAQKLNGCLQQAHNAK